MSKDTGGPAFPQHGWSSDPDVLARMQASGMGLTVRDYFAAKWLSGYQLPLCDPEGFAGRKYVDDTAAFAYVVADAMLKARNQ